MTPDAPRTEHLQGRRSAESIRSSADQPFGLADHNFLEDRPVGFGIAFTAEAGERAVRS